METKSGITVCIFIARCFEHFDSRKVTGVALTDEIR